MEKASQRVPVWKPLLIVAVLVSCFLAMYPPSRQLRPGLDLSGGTTLTYEVDVPEGRDQGDVIAQTIEVFKKRVDPDGIRNLVWKPLAGNRFEIQMAEAPRDTARKRQRYIDLRNALLESNITKRRVESVLTADPSRREAELSHLAGDNTAVLELLRAAAAAHDALGQAAQPYDRAKQARDEAASALAALPADAGDETRQAAQAALDTAQAQLIAAARAFVDGRKAYDAAIDKVLASNVDPIQLQHALDLSDQPATRGDPSSSPRAVALKALLDKHPDRADEITALAQAHAEYQKVKGGLDDPADLIALMRGAGVLEFRIAPAPHLVPDVEDYRRQLAEKGPTAGRDRDFRWFVLDDLSQFAPTRREQEALLADPAGYFASRRPGMVADRAGGKIYLLLANTRGDSLTQADEGWALTSATRTIDEMGFNAVAFSLNATGAVLMGQLTGAHKDEPMAIVLDGRVISAPNIKSRIGGSGLITGGSGGFSAEDLRYLLNTLNAGSLQARVSDEPISIKRTGPQLGQDNLHAGLKAAVVSLIAVGLFMAIYYLFAGLVANFALVANMVCILGVMAMREATFTLPGIAGIVLTIGMAVDANVLIYERIREELERGADLRTAIRLGYEKALSTIIDANVTTFITCVVLYYTATTEVKGFALTLMIGICATMFTALFCTRVIFDSYLRLTGAQSLPMLPTLLPVIRRLLSPNINWIGKRHILIPLSAILMLLSVVAVYNRGLDMLDIEFRSGTQVGFDIPEDQAMTLEEVRQRLREQAQVVGLPELADARPVSVGRPIQGNRYAAFSVSVLNEDVHKVSDAVKAAFRGLIPTQEPIAFAGVGEGHEAPELREAPVYPIRSATLGENINRSALTENVADYLGGVAVVLDDLQPAATLTDLRGRIERMRLQPMYEGLGFRRSTVVGLALAPEQPATGERLYRSVAVVTRDAQTNYAEDASVEAFRNPDGLAATEWRLVRDALLRDTSLSSVASFSSQVSATMKQQAIAAMGLSLLAVVIYIWVRFGSLRYGLAAIAALVHDVTIGLGMVAIEFYIPADSAVGRALLLDVFRIDLAMVAAVLTLIGYSLNDTIVVFDRIRENRGKLAVATPAVINDSINQTISRTTLTSGTTLIAILVLYIFGGPGVHGFAFMMLVGVVVGTYSSIAIAAPMLLIGTGAGAATEPTRPVTAEAR